MKPNIYAKELNTERIAAYRKLAEDFNLDEGTVRDIFCKGAEWGVDVADRDSPTHICGSEISSRGSCASFPFGYHPVDPTTCKHPVERRSYYQDSSWCNECNCYVDLPPHGNFKHEKRTIKYNGFWYGIDDKVKIGWKTYKVYFIGHDGGAVLKRKWGKEKQICGDVNIEIIQK